MFLICERSFIIITDHIHYLMNITKLTLSITAEPPAFAIQLILIIEALPTNSCWLLMTSDHCRFFSSERVKYCCRSEYLKTTFVTRTERFSVSLCFKQNEASLKHTHGGIDDLNIFMNCCMSMTKETSQKQG